ncbi:TRAP transporter substrate-binding protein [Corynebacterium sp. A21]|uniref:TRAP transporter substrate-binding protein n=1 Tax=Corynebacterium sp. A21 TaxID=3457318 RepID=UPI003FD5D48A
MRKRGPVAAVAALALSFSLTSCADLGGLDLETVGSPDKTTYIKLALNQAETHPSFIALESFSERFEEATDGRWKIQIFPNEQLGSQQEVLQFISSSAIEMAIVSGTQLENLNKDFQVLNMPTTFGSVDHQMSVIRDQDLMEPLFTSLEDANNISVIGGFTQGTRSIYTKDAPIETPEDLQGKKIRVQESDMHIRMIELMGGSATPLSYGEVYTAIQSGVLDGAENNEVSYVTQNHNEVAPFWSQTNHLVGLDYMVMRHDLLEAMPPADRELFLAEWDKAMIEHTDLWATETEEAIEEAKSEGATFTGVDEEAFREALAPIREEFLNTDFQNELFDAIRSADPADTAAGTGAAGEGDN